MAFLGCRRRFNCPSNATQRRWHEALLSLPTAMKTHGAEILDCLKAAGTLAATHAERTWLRNFSLPAAYRCLGRAVFEDNIGRNELTVQFASVDGWRDELNSVGKASGCAAAPNGFMQRAKAMGQAAANVATKEVLKVRFNHSLTCLGTSAYARRSQVGLPQHHVELVDSLLQKVSTLDVAAEQLRAQILGSPLLDNLIVQVLLVILCFPLGLFLIWRSYRWSKPAKMLWTTGVACLLSVLAVSLAVSSRSIDAPMPTATILADKGDELLVTNHEPRQETVQSDLNNRPKSEDDRHDGPNSRPNQPPSEVTLPDSKIEPGKSENTNADVLETSVVVDAQEKVLKVAKFQGEADHKIVQDLIRSKRLTKVSWWELDRRADKLSLDSHAAYQFWRTAIINATPPKYSIQDVKTMTSAKPEFSSTAALAAKTHLLNIAESLGGPDKSYVMGAIKSVEVGGQGWLSADLMMAHASFETGNAYREWKAAVFSAP